MSQEELKSPDFDYQAVAYCRILIKKISVVNYNSNNLMAEVKRGIASKNHGFDYHLFNKWKVVK